MQIVILFYLFWTMRREISGVLLYISPSFISLSLSVFFVFENPCVSTHARRVHGPAMIFGLCRVREFPQSLQSFNPERNEWRAIYIYQDGEYLITRAPRSKTFYSQGWLLELYPAAASLRVLSLDQPTRPREARAADLLRNVQREQCSRQGGPRGYAWTTRRWRHD